MNQTTILPTNGSQPYTPPNVTIAETIRLYFTQAFNVLAAKLHADNIARGFWPVDEGRNNGELIVLLTSETREGLQKAIDLAINLQP